MDINRPSKSPKRKRSASPKPNTTTPSPPPPKRSPSTTTITDLNDDCLMNIFERLPLRSLFNVGVASNWLIPAAATVYGRKFGQKKVCINYDNDSTEPFAIGPYCDFIGNQIKVHGFKQCLQYLRCFGASIVNLGIWCRQWCNTQCHRIYEYANQYGADSLSKIEFYGKPNISIGGIKKPFVRVQKILIFENDLNDRLPSFPQWFPNIQSLELNNVRVGTQYVETPFHQLSELRIDINADVFQRFNDKKVADLLIMCGQLQSLYIRVYDLQGMTMNALLNLIKCNPMLHSLTVSMTQYSMAVIQSEIRRFVQEHSTLVELNLPGYELTAENAILLVQEMDSLNKFSFKMNSLLEFVGFFAQAHRNFNVSLCSDSGGHIVTVVKP